MRRGRRLVLSGISLALWPGSLDHLLLDEPFAGLDEDGRDWLAAELAERAAEGAAILLTDHSRTAVDRLAPARVVELGGGRSTVRA